MKYLPLILASTLILSGCATSPTVTDPNAPEKLRWSQMVGDQKDKFAAWILTEQGQAITTLVMTLAGNGVFLSVPDDVLSPSTKKTLAEEMNAAATFYLLASDSSLTPAELDAAVKKFGPNISSEKYAPYFALFNSAIRAGTAKLQGDPAALKALLGCAAQAAKNVALTYTGK